MVHLADLGNLGIILALIWWIASSLLRKKNKQKRISNIADSPDNTSQEKKPGIFDWIANLEGKSIEQFIPEFGEIKSGDSEFEIPVDVELKDDEVSHMESSLPDELAVEHQKLLHTEIPVTRNTLSALGKKLRDTNEMHQAIILKEILDKPVALRKFFHH